MPINSKTRREAAFLVVVVFLLGALLGGIGTHLWGARVFGEQQQPAVHPRTIPRDQVVANFTHELQLTQTQQTQMGDIIDSTRAQVKALEAESSPKRDQIRQQGRTRIRAILTPDQITKYDGFMAHLDDLRKKQQAASANQ
jgi:hypothetical protein